MKKKNVKKLFLNKATVTHLDRMSMKGAVAGDDYLGDTGVATVEVPACKGSKIDCEPTKAPKCLDTQEITCDKYRCFRDEIPY